MKEKRNLLMGVGVISAFALWTVLIQCVDVQAVGQNGTKIGFAAFNVWFHQLSGVHMTPYTITDWLGLVPIFICLCFGTLGFAQLVKRRDILRVDSDLVLLGVYYVIVIACYLIFEMIPIRQTGLETSSACYRDSTVCYRCGGIYADETAICRHYLSDHFGREGLADRKGKEFAMIENGRARIYPASREKMESFIMRISGQGVILERI